jgi:transposase
MVLDNGAFHKAAALKIPDNIALVFLPPYSPELSPAEIIWVALKRKFSNKLHHTLDEVSVFISGAIKNITPKSVMSTCSFKYIFFKPILDYLIYHIGITP